MQVHIILNSSSGDVFLFDPAERQARPVSTEFAIKSPDIVVAIKQGDRIHFTVLHEPPLALGGHSSHDAECPFLNQSGHLASAYFLSTPVNCYDPSLSLGAASKARRRHW